MTVIAGLVVKCQVVSLQYCR